MDDRLKKIASNIEPGIGFADVGTDHGYIPAALALGGYTGRIYATDINSAPLQSAVRTAEEAGVADRITFRCCDGLALCDPEAIDTIVIAGMGGDLICRILDRAAWCLCDQYKLILQPMTKNEILRYWLVNNGFEIEREQLSSDGGKVYQIMVARFGGETKLSRAELFTGKYALCEDKALFTRSLGLIHKRLSRAVCGMESSGSEPGGRLALYRAILGELEEMGEKYDNGK